MVDQEQQDCCCWLARTAHQAHKRSVDVNEEKGHSKRSLEDEHVQNFEFPCHNSKTCWTQKLIFFCPAPALSSG